MENNLTTKFANQIIDGNEPVLLFEEGNHKIFGLESVMKPLLDVMCILL